MFCPDCLLAPGPHPSSCVRLGQDPQGQRILLNVAGASLELEEALERLRIEGCPENDLKRIRRLALGIVDGGIIYGPTLAMVGEAGPETVVSISEPESPETSSPEPLEGEKSAVDSET